MNEKMTGTDRIGMSKVTAKARWTHTGWDLGLTELDVGG